MTLPALVVVTGLLVWAVTAVTVQLRCVDAARAAARGLVRGDSVAEATATAQTLAPDHARIAISRSGGLVRVLVTTQVRPLGGLGALPAAVSVSGSVAARVEGTP
ncbi:MAG: hypothetical protein L0Y54_00490 [Sporichthyaceae bacterium]|nr:hypothetical protein [Sporichthyaceae bacterium]